MASPTQWTWVWVDSRSWWWTGRPGVLQFMGSQRVRHDWATEQQQNSYLEKNVNSIHWFSSVQFSRSVMSNSLWPHGLQHTRLPCPLPTPRIYPNSCALSWWCLPTISSSVISFSSCLQPFPVSWSFQMIQFFTSSDQSIRVSASTSVPPMNTQDWFLLGLTGLISLQSKGLSRVFSNTTVQMHQFFSAPPSSQSNSHIHTWPQEKP